MTSQKKVATGNIFGTTLARVEIECSDCHGAPNQYPWDLPLGFGEEFKKDLSAEPRGLAQTPPATFAFATAYPPKDGYLLTARGNPFGNIVKDGKKVVMHPASGLDPICVGRRQSSVSMAKAVLPR